MFELAGKTIEIVQVEHNMVAYRVPQPLVDRIDRIDLVTVDGRVLRNRGGSIGRTTDTANMNLLYDVRKHGALPEEAKARVRLLKNPRTVEVPVDLWITLSGALKP